MAIQKITNLEEIKPGMNLKAVKHATCSTNIVVEPVPAFFAGDCFIGGFYTITDIKTGKGFYVKARMRGSIVEIIDDFAAVCGNAELMAAN
jgi:hypothetical protein